MLIFQVGPRVAIISGEALPVFPAFARAVVELAPKEVFGEADLTGKLSVMPPGHTVQMSADLRHGAIRFQPGGRLPVFSVTAPLFDANMSIEGSTATVELECQTDAAFRRMVELIEHQLPALLSAALNVPIDVVRMTGSVAGLPYRVEFRGVVETPIRTLNQPDAVRRKFDLMQQLPEDGAWRVFSAHRYLLQARRLRYASNYPSEFLGERLLNLYKAIEVLFGRDVQQVRRQLAELGLKPEVIELLAGLVYVRDEIDVGHPAIGSLDAKQYETLHQYADAVEEIIPWLLDHLVSRLAGDRFQLRRLKLSSKRRTTLEKVAKSVSSVNFLQPETFLRDP